MLPLVSARIMTGKGRAEVAVTIDNTDGSSVLNIDTNTSVLQMNGKIGINTTTPDALLDIQSISTIEMNVITDQYSGLNNFIFSYLFSNSSGFTVIKSETYFFSRFNFLTGRNYFAC